MPRSTSTVSKSSKNAGFVLGRERFARISAVEGIELSKDMLATLEAFDRDQITAAERRRQILARFRPPR
jgi:hypothetical protein